MSDLLAQNFAPAQTNQQPLPNTIDAAASIAPQQRMTFLNGQTQVANIVPPTSGYCSVVLCFLHAAPGAFLTNGTAYPIKTAYQPIQNRPIELHWDPQSGYWWVAAVV